MPWFKVENSYYDHPKFGGISPTAEALFFRSIAFCDRNDTDGKMTARNVRDLVFRLTETVGSALPDELIRAGLWEVDGDDFKVHHFLEYQTERARKHEIAEQNRVRKRNHDASKRAEKSNANVTALHLRYGQESNGVRNGKVTPPTTTTRNRGREVDKSTSTGSTEDVEEKPSVPKMSPTALATLCSYETQIGEDVIAHRSKRLVKIDPDLDLVWLQKRIREAFKYDSALTDDVVNERFIKATKAVEQCYEGFKNGHKIRVQPSRYVAKAFFYSMIGYDQ